MKKVFIADSEFVREHTRKRAHGYKSLKIDDDVKTTDAVEFVTEGDTLVIKKADVDADAPDEAYCLLCKEFGLMGYSDNLTSDISVIFMDNGYMLVTLHKGAIACYLDGTMMLPSLECDAIPKFTEKEVLWVDQEKLLSFSKYLGNKEKFLYDFEFALTLKGSIQQGSMSAISLKHNDEGDVDMSLGYFAQYEQKMSAKEDMKRVRQLNSMFQAGASSQGFEFEDEDDDDEFEDDDDGYDF